MRIDAAQVGGDQHVSGDPRIPIRHVDLKEQLDHELSEALHLHLDGTPGGGLGGGRICIGHHSSNYSGSGRP